MSRITLVVPVWGSYCDGLRACLEDLRAQDVPAEILVVDNASDVPLPALPADVGMLRLPVRVSVGAARNAALALVTTPVVLFADADDRMLPGALSHLLALLDANPGALAAVGRQRRWSPLEPSTDDFAQTPRSIVLQVARLPRLLALCTLRFNVFPIVGCAALRTAAVRDCGGFGDGNIGEDWEIGAALAWRGPIVFSRRPVRRYVISEGSLWHRAHERQAFEALQRRFRERLFADPAVPRWARTTRPLMSLLQRRDLDHMFRDGPYRPEPAAARSQLAGTSQRAPDRPGHGRGIVPALHGAAAPPSRSAEP